MGIIRVTFQNKTDKTDKGWSSTYILISSSNKLERCVAGLVVQGQALA